MQGYGENEKCVNGCLDAASPEARALIDDVLACTQAAMAEGGACEELCAADPGAEACLFCVAGACDAEIRACLGG